MRSRLEAEGRPCVIRFAAPLTGTTTVYDVIRGDITVENASVVDPVLLKSDGLPTYHLAVVVDDHLMQITHILRGEEWIPSAPLHKMLFDAFGWQAPEFVHLPVILDPSGKGKMSKRKTVVDGKEFSPFVSDYITGGYLADAMFNFLANMGWSYDGEQEIFTPDYLNETATLVGIIAVGWHDAEGRPQQGVPSLAAEVDAPVRRLSESELAQFHRDESGRLALRYASVLMGMQNPLVTQLLINVIDRLSQRFPEQRGQLQVMRNNLAWRSIVQPAG